MGKNRGFKPQGLQLNPIKKVSGYSGQSMLEKLQRDSRPTWEELRKLARKKEECKSELLEQYENDMFTQKLQKYRNERIEEQERAHLKALREEVKKRKGSHDEDDGEKVKKRKKKEKKKKKAKRSKSKDKSNDKEEDVPQGSVRNNPYRLSSFFKLDKVE